MNILVDVNKHFELTFGKYQELKIKMENERSTLTENFEALNKEIEAMKSSKLMIFLRFRNKYNVHFWSLKIYSKVNLF